MILYHSPLAQLVPRHLQALSLGGWVTGEQRMSLRAENPCLCSATPLSAASELVPLPYFKRWFNKTGNEEQRDHILWLIRLYNKRYKMEQE